MKTLDPNWLPLMKVKYDPNADAFASSVESEPRDWGTVQGIDHLDNALQSQTYVYHELIDALQDAGYLDGMDLFGAPFDFRLESYVNAPKPDGLFEHLKALIEKMFAPEGETAVIVTHSEGSSIFRHFLANYVDQSWKQKFIKSWISASGAFGGAPSAFHYLISYKQWAVPTIDAKTTHDIIQFFSGLYWMLPSLNAFPSDYLLADVTAGTDHFVITVGNITEGFIRSVGGDQVYAAKNTLSAVNSEFANPNVETYIHYGTGVSTPTWEKYVSGKEDDWWQQDGEAKDGDGDGTVPIESLTAPFVWLNSTKEPIYTIKRPGVSHSDLISDEAFIADVITIATRDTAAEAARGIYSLRRRFVHTLHEHTISLQQDILTRLGVLREWVTAAVAERKGEKEQMDILKEKVRFLLEEAGEVFLHPALSSEFQIYNTTRLTLRAMIQPLLQSLSTTPLEEEREGIVDSRTSEGVSTEFRRAIYQEYEDNATALVKQEIQRMDIVHQQLVGESGELEKLEEKLRQLLV